MWNVITFVGNKLIPVLHMYISDTIAFDTTSQYNKYGLFERCLRSNETTLRAIFCAGVLYNIAIQIGSV